MSNGSSAPVECPVCDATCSSHALQRYTAHEAAAHFCSELRDADRHARLEASIRKLWRGDECIILRCETCGFVFGHPFIGGDEEFYSILHEQYGYPTWRWDYDFALREAVSQADGGRILDIGAGEGAFLKRLGAKWKRYAVEGSETTRSILERNGITVLSDLAHAVRLAPAGFAVVTAFQVLEHLSGFRSVLTSVRDLLTSNGRVVITVPDAEMMLAQPGITGEHDMPPNHINKWSPKSLSTALGRAGFEVIRVEYEPFAWRSLAGTAYSLVRGDSTKPGTLAARAYKIKRKALRAPILAGLGALYLPRLLPHRRHFRTGGTFAVVARPSFTAMEQTRND